MKSLLFIFTLFFSFSAIAARPGLSAVRYENETFETARKRSYLLKRIAPEQAEAPRPRNQRYATAETVRASLENLNLAYVPSVASYEVLLQKFSYIRDTRFIEHQTPEFPRRFTWLYPDDGCYARAELAKNELNKILFVKPKKIFVFGSLKAFTNNTASGVVRWWYHVALAYQVAGVVYVLDPSLNPHQPMTIQQWDEAVGGANTRLKYSLCEADTFDPREPCYEPVSFSAQESQREQDQFLGPEWRRLESLGRNPEIELGDSPPWLVP